MNTSKTGTSSAMPSGMRRIVLALVALSLAVVVAFAGALQVAPQAYASIYPASEAAAQVDKQGASSEAAAASDQAAQEEAIEDEEVPMASGLGGAEPVASSGMSFQWVIIAGIVAVVAFFGASTFRLNKSISSMKDRMK